MVWLSRACRYASATNGCPVCISNALWILTDENWACRVYVRNEDVGGWQMLPAWKASPQLAACQFSDAASGVSLGLLFQTTLLLRGRLILHSTLQIFPNPSAFLSITCRIIDNIDCHPSLSRHTLQTSRNPIEEEPHAILIQRVIHVCTSQKELVQRKCIAMNGLNELSNRDVLSVSILDEQLRWA
jgi:hypothetical protein